MKKLLLVLAAFMLMVPFTVKANTYPTYQTGDEVNFYAYPEDQEGHTSIILEDKGSSDQFVKAWFVGIVGTSSDVYADTVLLKETATPFESSGAHRVLTSHLNTAVQGFGGHAKDITQAGNLQLITLQELISVFGAVQSGDTYTIDVDTWGSVFQLIVTSAQGIFTQTVEGDNVWVVEFGRAADGVTLTSITVKKVPWASTQMSTYAVSPVVYIDKTYDCTETTVESQNACYKCGEDYTWTVIGQQADTCELVADITSEAKCVTSPDTGVEEYILEFIAVAGVCGLAIVIIKRKDLFRSI